MNETKAILEPKDITDIRREQEAPLTESMEKELTDEQLLQLAEGSCSWGANCKG
ncbi:MAG: hypothetical protein WCD76_07770 [Pyrinomonadaceae bacterium]